MRHSKRTHKTILIAATAAALLAIPALIAAQPRGPGGFCGPGWHEGFGPHGPFSGRMMERLDLSEAQRGEVRGVLESHRPQLDASFGQLADARQALRDQIHSEVFDEGAIRAAAAGVASIEAEMAVTRGRIFQEIGAILTPEQKEELAELQSAMRTLKSFHGPRSRPGWGPPTEPEE